MLCLCMPLGEYVLVTSLVNKSSELQGHLINPLYFSLRGFVNDVARTLDSSRMARLGEEFDLDI